MHHGRQARTWLSSRTQRQRITVVVRLLQNPFDVPMIVAMAPMRMVQMSADEIIDMVAVRNPLVSTTWSVDVVGVVLATCVIRGALGLVFSPGFKDVIIDVIAVCEVQVAVVEIIDMAVVFHTDVAATGRVGVCVLTFVSSAIHLRSF